jgi:hypothetical protein
VTVSNLINARHNTMRPETTPHRDGDPPGYRPHTTARNLRLSTRLSIGMVIVDEAPLYLADPSPPTSSPASNRLSRDGYGLQIQGTPPTLRCAAIRHDTHAIARSLFERTHAAMLLNSWRSAGRSPSGKPSLSAILRHPVAIMTVARWRRRRSPRARHWRRFLKPLGQRSASASLGCAR